MTLSEKQNHWLRTILFQATQLKDSPDAWHQEFYEAHSEDVDALIKKIEDIMEKEDVKECSQLLGVYFDKKLIGTIQHFKK